MTITYYGEVDNSVDIIILNKLLCSCYSIVYVCKDKDSMSVKIQQLEELIKKLQLICKSDLVSIMNKDYIRLLNGSAILFICIKSSGGSLCGRSANMLVYEDEEYFKDQFPKEFEELQRSFIPIVATVRNGILIS